MSAEKSQATFNLALHLFGLAFTFFLMYQALALWSINSALQAQNALQVQQLQALQAQLPASLSNMNRLEALATDLLNLGNSDAEVRKISEKYQIRRTGNQTP